ncbi:MAG: hypothetical protein KBE15_05940 [Budvicia sp.]|nr:hypothetical protein [Budvicia sp.]
MGHNIQVIIGATSALATVIQELGQFAPILTEDLPLNFKLAFISEQLQEQVEISFPVSSASSPTTASCFLSMSCVHYLESISSNTNFIYAETHFFGGTGIQNVWLFRTGEPASFKSTSLREFDVLPNSEWAINDGLAQLGVVRDINKDEFDTLKLSKYRVMPDDLDNN